MAQETFRRFKRVIRSMGFYRKHPGQTHSDGAILAVHFWAALNDRPSYWACDRANWPKGCWRGRLPTQSGLSRRLNTARFKHQQASVEVAARPPSNSRTIEATAHPPANGLTVEAAAGAPVNDLAVEAAAGPPAKHFTVAAGIDAKPIIVAWHSGDPHAGKGRGAGALARGYKIHAIVDACGRLISWRLASLNADEKTIGRRLLRDLDHVCYVVGDAAYNANRLFEAAASSGARLVAPRKKSHRGKGLGNHEHHPDRLRSIDLLEDGVTPFAAALLAARVAIERFFSQITAVGGGLTCLPSWVRTYPRVKAWVTAKLTIHHLRQPDAESRMAA